jgi:hypothetical protein
MPAPSRDRRPPRYDPSRDASRLRRGVWVVAGLIVIWGVVGRSTVKKWFAEPDRDVPPGKSAPLVESAPVETPLPEGVVRIPPAAVEPLREPPPPAAGERSLKKVGGYVVEIPRTSLDLIRHDFHGLRASEAATLDLFLDRVRATPLNVLEQVAAAEFSYAELHNDPERYSGRIATFRGRVRQCEPLTIRRSDGYEQRVYEAWLFTESGGRKNPYRILCDTLPKGFPVGSKIDVDAGITGYFFKRYGYATLHGPHAAPMFVAKRFRWSPRDDGELTRGVTWAGRAAASFFALLAVAFSLASWWWTGRRRPRTVFRRAHRSPAAERVDFDPRESSAEPSVEEFLRSLSASAEGPQPSPEEPAPEEPGPEEPGYGGVTAPPPPTPC